MATATVTLAAEAPDLDVLGRLHGPVFGFEHHRGFTHSILGVALVAAGVTCLMYVLWRLRGRRTRDPNLPPRWGLLFLFSYFAGLSHILLDFTNNYGVRPYWPFSERWYSWDIVFIFEPVMFVMLVLGLILPSFFALIRNEIGARQRGLKGRLAATLALLGAVLLWGVRDYEHRRAVAALESRTYQDTDPQRVSAYPLWNNPFRWFGVVETSNFFALVPVDSSRPEVEAAHLEIRYKPEETPVTLAAKRSYLGRAYLDWAQYPLTITESLDSGGYLVQFEDLRFAYAWRGSDRKPLSAGVELDRHLNVTAEMFGVRRQPVVPNKSEMRGGGGGLDFRPVRWTTSMFPGFCPGPSSPEPCLTPSRQRATIISLGLAR